MQDGGSETNSAHGLAEEIPAASTSLHMRSARVDFGPSSPKRAQGAPMLVPPLHTSCPDAGETGSPGGRGEGSSQLEGYSTGDSKCISIGEHIPGECGQSEEWPGEQGTPTSKPQATCFSFVKLADSPRSRPASPPAQISRYTLYFILQLSCDITSVGLNMGPLRFKSLDFAYCTQDFQTIRQFRAGLQCVMEEFSVDPGAKPLPITLQSTRQ
jgi:hypothetical protein